jgi:hypothetical protein
MSLLDGIRSKIDTVRANRAQNAVEARQNAFTINEFGDVGIVNYNTLDKVDNNIKKEDIANLLKGNAVQVRTPNIPQRGPNPHDPRKVWKIYEPFTSFIANLFNARTTGRANRLQHELELQLGRVAGNLVNMAAHHAGGDHHLVGKEAQKAVDAMAVFVRQVEDFAKLYSLDATNPTAVKDLIQKFATRLANSIKDDPTAVHQIYTMAKQWQVNKTELTQTDEVVMALRRALAPHEAKALATAAAAAAKPAPVAKPLSPEEQRRQERAALKRDLANQITAAKALCTKAGEEMRVFEKAIDEVTNELKNLDDAKGLSGANFRELVDKMDRTMKEIISKGRTIIDVTRVKKQERLKEVQEELAKEYGDISEIKVDDTNRLVKDLLMSNWQTAEDFIHNFREVTFDTNPDAKWKNLNTSDANSTVNHMNMVIREFSSARAKLFNLRNRVEQYELKELLEAKAQTPPEGADTAAWQEACHAIEKYVGASSADALKEVTQARFKVLQNHRKSFLNDAPASLKRAFDQIETHFNTTGFVDTTKADAMPVASASFKACEQAMTQWVSQLLDYVQFILNPVEPSPSDKKAAEALKKYLDAAHFNLEERIQEDVAETLDALHGGVFFERDGKRCYLENSAIEILFSCVRKAVVATRGSVVNMNVANLATVKGAAYTAAREKVVVELKTATQPYVNAQRTMREMLLGSALTRIRAGLDYIRSAYPSKFTTKSWDESCDYLADLLANVHKLDVEDVKYTCQYTLQDIREEIETIEKLGSAANQNQIAKLNMLKKIEPNFTEDVARLFQYSEEGELYGDNDLTSAIHQIDRLKLTYKRMLDLQNLISNSLEVLPQHLNQLEVAWNKDFLDSRIVSVQAGALRPLADQLRTDYAVYTRKVAEYAAFLREKNVGSVDETKHIALVNGVRDALSICTTSFMQMMHLISEVEVYARDQFLYYDEVVAKSKIAAKQAIENGDTTAPEIKEPSKICTNEVLAKILRDMRLAVQNGFCALSEIPRGLLLEQGSIAEQEGLPLLTMTAVDATYGEMRMTVETKRKHERGTISMIGDGAVGADVFAVNHKIPTLLQEDQKALKVQKVRRIFIEGFGSQASLRQTMTRRGSRSAELFNATENATLALAAEKRRRATNTGVCLQEETIKAIQQLIDARIPITTETELFDYLTKTVMDELNANKLIKVNEAKVKHDLETDFKMLDGGDASGLTQKLITLSSKWKAYGILRQGETVREYSAQEMSKHVKGEGYKVLWLNETHGGKTNRALLEDKKGNRLFYTLTAKKETEEKVKVAFIPEKNLDPNSKAAFKEFSVTMSKKKMGLAVEEELKA